MLVELKEERQREQGGDSGVGYYGQLSIIHKTEVTRALWVLYIRKNTQYCRDGKDITNPPTFDSVGIYKAASLIS